MTVRSDLAIDWVSSPRIITVASPSVLLTVQDLVDTLRFEEEKLENASYPVIVQASGKEPLGGGVKVGVTVSLQNAQVAFATRLGPTYIQCSITGGNLVAFDTDGLTVISSVFPTAFTQVLLTSSASATLQEQDALQYSSYQNAVWVDENALDTGTEFPVGTREFPVNNAMDAVLIANEKGFDTLQIVGNYTFNSGDDISGFNITGRGVTKSTIAVTSGAIAIDCLYRNCYLFGVLDGGSEVHECLIINLSYVDGYLYKCILNGGVITLDGNNDAYFIECVSGINVPTINFGGSGQGLAVRGQKGRLALENKTGADPCAIDFESGVLEVDNTLTAGILEVSNVDAIVGTTGGTTIVQYDNTLTDAERDTLNSLPTRLEMTDYIEQL